MNINIDIPDNVLRAAVEQQVSLVMAKFTGEALEKMAEAVIAKKMDRFDPAMRADSVIRQQVDKIIGSELERALGRNWQRNEAVRKLLSDAAQAAIKGALK